MAEEEACINTFVNTVSSHDICHFSYNFSKKIDIIRDVIISIAAILKKIVHHSFVTLQILQSMTLPNFMSKPFPIRIYAGERGIIRQKYPGADKVKTMHQKWSFPLRISSVNVTKSAVVRCKSYCLQDGNRRRARYYRRWTPKVILNAPFSSVPNGHVSSDY